MQYEIPPYLTTTIKKIMKSKIAQQVIDETPEDVKIFVRKYGDIVVRIHQILRDRIPRPAIYS